MKAGIKVYPVNIKGKWYIQSDNNGKLHTFPKELKQNEINEAMAKTYIYYAEKLKEKSK